MENPHPLFQRCGICLTGVLRFRLILFGELIPDLLPSLQDQMKQQRQQHGDTDNGKVLAPVARCLIARIAHDAQYGHIADQHGGEEEMFRYFPAHGRWI